MDLRTTEHYSSFVKGLKRTGVQQEGVVEQHHNEVDSYMEVLGKESGNLVVTLQLRNCHRHKLE